MARLSSRPATEGGRLGPRPDSTRGPATDRTSCKVTPWSNAEHGLYPDHSVRWMPIPSESLMTSARPSEWRVLRYDMGTNPRVDPTRLRPLDALRHKALGTPHEPSPATPLGAESSARTVTAVGPIKRVPVLQGTGRQAELAPTSEGGAQDPNQ